MLKRGISALIVLCLLTTYIVCVPAAASGETKVTLNKKIKYNAGKTKISWKVDGEEPESCALTYQMVDSSTVPQSRIRWEGITKHSFETGDLIPGKKYEVILWGPFNSVLARRTYSVPEAEEFADGKLKASSVRITVEPVKMKSGGNPRKDAKKTGMLKAAEIIDSIKNGNTEYGVKYTMKMPRLDKARTVFVTIVFESPDGYMFVEKSEDLTFLRAVSSYDFIGYRFFYFMFMERQEVPAGTYKIHLFWDGMKVGTQTFKVK